MTNDNKNGDCRTGDHGSVTAGLVVTRMVTIGQSDDHKTGDYRTNDHKKGGPNDR